MLSERETTNTENAYRYMVILLPCECAHSAYWPDQTTLLGPFYLILIYLKFGRRMKRRNIH